MGSVKIATAQCPNLIVNGDFSSGSGNWIKSYPSSPSSGPIDFNGGKLNIAVDNDGDLYPGEVLLANTTNFTVTAGQVYFFSVNMNRYNDISTAANFSWVLLNTSNGIAMTLGSTYTTGGANASGAVTVPNAAPVTYSYCFNSTLPTGTYRIALTWQAFEDGFSRDIIVDDLILNEFNPKITSVGVINCSSPTAQLSVEVCGSGNTIVWKGSGIVSGQGSSTIVINAVGHYEVAVIGSNTVCAAKDTITISQSGTGSAFALSVTKVDTTCVTGGFGSATVNVTGGVAPYTFSWNTTPVQTSATANGLAAGAYTCIVTDAKGCKDSIKVNLVSLGNSLIAIAATTNVKCFGESTGSAKVNVTGGTPPFSYSWNVSPPQTSNSISNVGAGQYICTIKDSLGCEGKKTIVINEPARLTINLSGKKVICKGSSTVLSVLANGGTAPYAMAWNHGLNAVNTPTIKPLVSTTYVVTVTDKNNCIAIDSIFVAVTDKPIIDFTPADSGCVPLKVAFVNTTQNASAYSWNFGDGSGSGGVSPTHYYNLPGLFTVKLVAANQACSDSLEKKNYIHAFPSAKANLLASAANVSEFNPEVTFTNLSTYSDLCQIDFGDGHTENTCGEVFHIYDSVKTYTVTLIAKTVHGCDDTTSIQVRVYEETTLFVPNAFTPNTDNLNAVFMAKGSNIHSYEMRVFDRWGLEVYHGNDLEKGWDGTYQGKKVQDDVYVYVIKYTDASSRPYIKKGTLNLIR